MAKNSDSEDRLESAARAGWLYYIAGNSQDEIARKLGVSRQTAQRLVSLSVSQNLMKFRLDHPLAKCLELAEQLKAALDLSMCEVVPSDPDAPGLLAGVAAAGATVIERSSAAKHTYDIAFGTGRALRACVEQMPVLDCPEHLTVSLVGNVQPNGTATGYNIVVRMAHRVGSGYNPMPLPVLVRNATELPILQAQEPVARTLKLCAEADATFVGIGHLDATSPMMLDGFITAEESRLLVQAGAVGEIVGWAYDVHGQLIEGSFNSRVSSAPIVPGNPRPVTGIAVGESKSKAILGACRGGLINGLITDEATAKAILALC